MRFCGAPRIDYEGDAQEDLGERERVDTDFPGVIPCGVVRKLLTFCLCGFCPGRLV